MKPAKNFFCGKYGFLWVTGVLFLISLSGHWIAAWFTYVDEQKTHHQLIEFSGYFNQTMRDTLENWQSEFLQLIWQVAGLKYLVFVGSPQSKEGDEKKDAKLDFIIEKLDPKHAKAFLRELEQSCPQK
jgi:hypothetical protein